MKDLPEIAPELRGLLEEIVANPRSSIRLAPRRALRSWFDTDETIRASDVSGTTAERHLVEAHREALAKLLCEASRIAYWKAPTMSHRPVDDSGQPYDPSEGEPHWQGRVERRFRSPSCFGNHVGLFRDCLMGITPAHGQALAIASLSLVSGNQARLCLAFHRMKSSPRWALRAFERTACRTSSPALRGLAWAAAGSLHLLLNRFEDAVHAYEMGRPGWPNACFYLFNLACLMERTEEAVRLSQEIGQEATLDSTQVEEAFRILIGWCRTRPVEELRRTRSTLRQIGTRIPEAAGRVALAYDC